MCVEPGCLLGKNSAFQGSIFLPGETVPYTFFQERKIVPSLIPV